MLNQAAERQKPYWLLSQMEAAGLTSTIKAQNSVNGWEDAPIQRLCYSSDLPYQCITSNLIKNLLSTLEKFDARQAKPRNAPYSSADAYFENYTNFEPATCTLQRTQEFQTQPLLKKPVVSNCKPQVEETPVQSQTTIPDERTQHTHLNSPTEVIFETRARNFDGSSAHGTSKQQEQQQNSLRQELTPKTEANTPSKQEVVSTALELKPEMIELEISKSVRSKKKTPKEQISKLNMKSILKKTFAKTEALFAKNENKPETVRLSEPSHVQHSHHTTSQKTQEAAGESQHWQVVKAQHQFNAPEEIDKPAQHFINGLTTSDSEACQPSTSFQQTDDVHETIAQLKPLPELEKQALECKPRVDTTATGATAWNTNVRGESKSRTAALSRLADE
ncbi:unnamed protein product [Gongylonema pulchrum]|uniref:Uncharacterized protein n=1 Tax=Gongylonema pulchrum TaxID=637853 RepID=A0A3P7NUS7_9BILA|nr:unnamed protein product [Gongylonema pulchrum]